MQATFAGRVVGKRFRFVEGPCGGQCPPCGWRGAVESGGCVEVEADFYLVEREQVFAVFGSVDDAGGD